MWRRDHFRTISRLLEAVSARSRRCRCCVDSSSRRHLHVTRPSRSSAPSSCAPLSLRRIMCFAPARWPYAIAGGTAKCVPQVSATRTPAVSAGDEARRGRWHRQLSEVRARHIQPAFQARARWLIGCISAAANRKRSTLTSSRRYGGTCLTFVTTPRRRRRSCFRKRAATN